MRSLINIGLVVALPMLLSYVFVPIYDKLVLVGTFRKLQQSPLDNPDHLVVIDDTIHCEDMHYHAESNSVFTACEDSHETRFSWFPGLTLYNKPLAVLDSRGSIHVIDAETKTSRRLKFVDFNGPFVTHGIDVINDPNAEVGSAVYIFAVNHVPGAEYLSGEQVDPENPKLDPRIEIFHHVIGSDSARHVRSVKNAHLKTPNDVLAVSPTTFYVTNDHYYTHGHLRSVEDLLPTAKWTDTIRLDCDPEAAWTEDYTKGCKASVALQSLQNNNGLAHGSSPDEVLIGCPVTGEMHIGTLPSSPEGKIHLSDVVRHASTIDNPSYFSDPYANATFNASGYVNAGLTRAVDLATTGGDPKGTEGVMIWYARRDGNSSKDAKPKEWNPKLVFEDDGKRIRCASVAVIVAIDPKKEGGQRKAWLFVSGFTSASAWTGASRGAVVCLPDYVLDAIMSTTLNLLSQVPLPTPPQPSFAVRRTFRVKGVPLDWDAERLESFLRGTDTTSRLTVHSLLEEPRRSRGQTATLTFHHIPPQFQNLHVGQHITKVLRGHRPLTIDVDFHGMTTLYAPPPEDHKINVIAVCGLGGHAFDSFVSPDGGHMWLRDSLPFDMVIHEDQPPMARIMTYGYDSVVSNSDSIQNLADLANSFHGMLLPLLDGPLARPIICIAHGLGGLVVKELLIYLARSERDEDKRLLQAIQGLVFFGTPHHGMDIRPLIPMAANGPNRFLLESISHINSQVLHTQHREFHRAFGDESKSSFEVVCFYETNKSPTARQDGLGNWSMTGPKEILVTTASATHCRSWEQSVAHICPIARCHGDLVKFTPNDNEYDKVLERLKALAGRIFKPTLITNINFLVPYVPNPDFVERTSIMLELKKKLGLGIFPQAPPRLKVSLYGLGGIGKTHIALHYVYWLRGECPDVSIYWVHGGSRARFTEGFAAIAKKCKVPGYDDPKANVLSLVKDWLSTQHHNRWLLVIDNADDEKLFFPTTTIDCANTNSEPLRDDVGIASYIPECDRGFVLVTTRNKAAAVSLSPGNSLIEVPKMSQDEAVEVLRTAIDDTTTGSVEDVQLLASRLEYIPLAMAQANAFMQQYTMTIKRFMELLDENEDSVVELLSQPFHTVGRDGDAPHAVIATWMLSFTQIHRNHPLASQFLCFMSLLDRQNIPLKFISEYYSRLKHADGIFVSEQQEDHGNTEAGDSFGTTSNIPTPWKLEIFKAIGVLKSFSFITETKEGDYDMHRLVQLATYHWLQRLGTACLLYFVALKAVTIALPLPRCDADVVCRKSLPHAESVLTHYSYFAAAALEQGFGLSAGSELDRATLQCKIVTSRGCDSKRSKALLLQAASVQTRLLGESDYITLSTQLCLSQIYINEEDWVEAEKRQTRILESFQATYGRAHPYTGGALSALAWTYRHTDRADEALKMQIEALESYKTTLGLPHANTVSLMADIALTFHQLGRVDQARNIMKQVYEVCKTNAEQGRLANDIRFWENLAIFHSELGEWDTAAECFEHAILLSRNAFGANHLVTLRCQSLLGICLLVQGQMDKSESMLSETYEIVAAKFGSDDESTLACLFGLAVNLCSQDRFAEVEELLLTWFEEREEARSSTKHT
ncbi:hypothetical protein S40293_08631, partial [Stachybotrys chartarum IBT 40293]